MENDNLKVNYELVDQINVWLKTQGINLTRVEAYNYMVQFNMIDKTGQPTQFAIDNGLIEQHR